MKMPYKILYTILRTHVSYIGAIVISLCVCVVTYSQDTGKSPDADIEIFDVSLQKVDETHLNDTITVKFNILKKGAKGDEDRMLNVSPGDSIQVNINELIGKRAEKIKPEYIPNSLDKIRNIGGLRSEIPDDYYISILVDKSGSISQEDMEQVRSALMEFATIAPKGHLFYSWFDEDISESKVVTPDKIDALDFKVSQTNSALYNAIHTKLVEFDSTQDAYNQENEPHYRPNKVLEKAKDGNKYLIVISNGANYVEQINKYTDPIISRKFIPIMEPTLIDAIESYKKKVFIYAVSLGEKAVDSRFFEMICIASGNKSGSVVVPSDSILQAFSSLGTQIAEQKWDYEMKLVYKNPKSFGGERRTLVIELISYERGIFLARGQADFGLRYGTRFKKLSIGESTPLNELLLLGLLTGVIVFLLVLFTIQLIIPMIRNRIFIIKYVKKYKPGGIQIYKECQYCGDQLNPGEKVVTKCKHVVHHLCWKDYGHMCPEYGQNCNEGKEDFFDISDPFSKKNKIYYLNWVVYGMIGGYLSWLLYVLLVDRVHWMFDFSRWLTKIIRPTIDLEYLEAFALKIAPLLIVGTLLGFFLTIFYSVVEEYRHKSAYIYFKIFLRGLMGAISGFLSFLLGCVILILINHPVQWYFDWLPWIFFGMTVGLIMSVNTTIVWKHGVIGGLISIIFCFIMIYLFAGDVLEQNIVLTGFMLYGAGLGASIATVRSRSEHFFLKIAEGKKSQDTIPVHKWMSSSGGHNEVYIGRSFACEIQMNWEKNNEEIAQKHAKMYINTRGAPVIISLDSETSIFFNDRFNLTTGKEYELYNGVRFKIGNTIFKYIENE